MKYIVFTEGVAAFAYNRLNNVLFSQESLTRVNLIGAMGLQVDGSISPKERIAFDEVLTMFGGSFSDVPPPAFTLPPNPIPVRATPRRDRVHGARVRGEYAFTLK